MIDVSVLIDLTDPTIGRPPTSRAGMILFLGGGLIAFAALCGLLFLIVPRHPDAETGRSAPEGKPAPRWMLWLLGLVLIAVFAAAVSSAVKGTRMQEALRATHEQEVKDYEAAVAARDRETKKADKIVTAAIEDQYKVEEARTGWGRTGDWQSARKALSASKMDAPRVTVVTEDNRRGFVLVEYDNASGEVTLLSDTSDRQQGSTGIDVAGLRR